MTSLNERGKLRGMESKIDNQVLGKRREYLLEKKKKIEPALFSKLGHERDRTVHYSKLQGKWVCDWVIIWKS